MKTHSRYTTFIVITTLSALVFLSAWVFLIYKTSVHNERAHILVEEVRLATEKNTHLSSVKTALDEVSQSLGDAQKRFVKTEDVPLFITFLEATAADRGVEMVLGAIQIDDVSVEDQSLRIRMSGSGTWDNVMSFVSTLDAAPYALSIESFSCIYSVETKTWRFTLDVMQYLQK